jgi:hypothetical protein
VGCSRSGDEGEGDQDPEEICLWMLRLFLGHIGLQKQYNQGMVVDVVLLAWLQLTRGRTRGQGEGVQEHVLHYKVKKAQRDNGSN